MTEKDVDDDQIVAIRREQLRRWIDEFHDGSQAAFAASTADGETQINQGELSGLLRSKSFGEKRARRLEKQAGMPHRYLDSTVAASQAKSGIGFAPSPPLPQAAPRVLWPFKLASLQRINELRMALGHQRANDALADIDSHLDIVLSKWEREAHRIPKKGARQR